MSLVGDFGLGSTRMNGNGNGRAVADKEKQHAGLSVLHSNIDFVLIKTE